MLNTLCFLLLHTWPKDGRPEQQPSHKKKTFLKGLDQSIQWVHHVMPSTVAPDGFLHWSQKCSGPAAGSETNGTPSTGLIGGGPGVAGCNESVDVWLQLVSGRLIATSPGSASSSTPYRGCNCSMWRLHDHLWELPSHCDQKKMAKPSSPNRE